MIHAHRHTPIVGITMAHSEKADKVSAHRRERRRVRQTLDADPAAEIVPHTRELSDMWAYAKDGKQYLRGGFSSANRRK